jgi:hypothetical protein
LRGYARSAAASPACDPLSLPPGARTGAVVLLTGAGSAVWRLTAKVLAERGVKVISLVRSEASAARLTSVLPGSPVFATELATSVYLLPVPSRSKAWRSAVGRQGRTMRRREFITLLGGTVAAALSACLVALRQAQAQNRPRVGLVFSGSSAGNEIIGFKQGLRELGYVEGQNIDVEYRSSPRRVSRN